MTIPPLHPKSGEASPQEPWPKGEAGPVPLLPRDNPWVQWVLKMWPGYPFSPQELSVAAQHLQHNMMQMFNTTLSRIKKMAKEASDAMKRAIEGTD